MPLLADWPAWAAGLLWSTVTIGGALALGYLLRTLVAVRLKRLASRTARDWDDTLIREVKRRMPVWSLLLGVYLALPYWDLDEHRYQQIVNLLSAFAVASVTFAIAAIASHFVSHHGPRAVPSAPVSALTHNVVRAVILGLGALVIARLFVDITPYLAALGVGGLAVALAVQDPLSNFFAGIFMSASGQIHLGQYVKLDSGAEGYIADVNWRATSIRTPANNLIILPNSKLAQAAVTSFDLPSRDLAVTVEAGVHYLSDLGAVERVTCDVARSVMKDVAGGVQAFEPSVRFHTFGPSAINFSVVMRGQDVTDTALLKHEFIKRLQRRYVEEGIVMPFAPIAAEVQASGASSADGTTARG